MADAVQHLNGSRDLTTPLLGMVCRLWLALTMITLSTKFEVYISAHHEDTKGDTK